MKNLALVFNRNMVFTAILAIALIAIINRITPPHVAAVFKLVISKNRAPITNIHQARDIDTTKEIYVDRINLAEKSRFRHSKLGDLGFGEDFFVDVDAPFTVKKAGDYIFSVGSDDGFIFSVDGKQLCEWTHDRPLTTDACRVSLTEGKHNFKLVYFQGYGNAGLIMSYSNAADGSQYLAGEDSKFISF